jgi:soluble lytic murein transglycosylase-like protein
LGSTQMLPATAREMAGKLGLPWRPDLLQSNDPEALDYQRRLGAAYLKEGLAKTGNIRDALRYYHGGPDPSMWGPKTNAYANAVLGMMGGQ